MKEKHLHTGKTAIVAQRCSNLVFPGIVCAAYSGMFIKCEKYFFTRLLCACGLKFAGNEKGMVINMSNANNCESCMNYVFDEEYDCYICEVNLDEDDMGRFLSGSAFHCPHFQFNDEYKIVRKQI